MEAPNPNPNPNPNLTLVRLAELRAGACMEALVARGVHSRRLWVTYKGRSGAAAQKADFIPHASREQGRHRPLPAGLPYRLLHLRNSDGDLATAMQRTRAFLLENDIRFNGAGEELPSAEQAWAVDHLDAQLRGSNQRIIDGLAAIMAEFPNVQLEVHGETGPAHAAPRQLADYLDMHRVEHVEAIMERLAQMRAQANIDRIEEIEQKRV